MKVLDIKEIKAEDNYIYYRRGYAGTALVELPSETIELPVHFIIETEPTGRKNIEINILKQILYPMLPIIQELKKKILFKSDEGQLPC